MSILEEKIRFSKMVLDIEDESLIEQMKGFFLLNQEVISVQFPSHLKESINKSIRQANKGELISLVEFKAKHFFKK